ncbi:MAG: hypothetical protein RL748_526 [Pseudomonadota bacterium]|jgi:ABC-2 type transport system permease protein
MIVLTALIRKDLLLFVADRRALILTLIMPVVLAAFFGYLFGGSGERQNGKIEIGLVQLDQSETSRKIAASLKADSNLKVLEMSAVTAQAQVKKGKLSAAVVLPVGFGEAAANAFFNPRTKPEIPIYYDPSQSVTLAMLKGILTQYIMQHVSADAFSGKGGDKVIDDTLQKLEQDKQAENAELKQLLGSLKKFKQSQLNPTASNKDGTLSAGLSTPFATKDAPLTSGPKYNGYSHSFAGMSVQFILFMGIDAGIGILLMRNLGIWNRLLAAPIGLGTILLARILASTILAFLLLCFIFLFGILIFKIDIAGSVPGFFGIGLSFCLMTATFGLLIAAFGKTPEAARGIAVFVSLLMVMLGGAWVPSMLFPQWLQTATLVIPIRWAVDGMDAMTWRGLGLQEAFMPIAVLLGFALVFGCLASWKMKREQA